MNYKAKYFIILIVLITILFSLSSVSAIESTNSTNDESLVDEDYKIETCDSVEESLISTASENEVQSISNNAENSNTVLVDENSVKSDITNEELNETYSDSNIAVKGNENLINTNAQTFNVTNSTFFDYFNSNGTLKDSISDGATLDFQGIFYGNTFTVNINKPINMISTTNDAVFNNIINFTISNGGSYSNMSNIKICNSQFIVINATNVTINHINLTVVNTTLGKGQGVVSIRENSKYITLKNSYFHVENDGGSTIIAFSLVDNCTFDNNTVEGVGTVGNLIYFNIYNQATTSGFNSYNKITNNRIIGPTTTKSAWAIAVSGNDNLIANNTIDYYGSGIVPIFVFGQPPVAMEHNYYINNTLTGGCGISALKNSIVENNSVEGTLTITAGCNVNGNTVNSLSVSGANATIQNNVIHGTVSISSSSASNTTLINNTINNTVTVKSNDNVIKGNEITTSANYTIDLGSKTGNIVTDNLLISKKTYGDASVLATSSNNTIENNRPYLAITNSTFFDYFNNNGTLKDNITNKNLIFVGLFENLGINTIIINRSVNLISNDAVLSNIALNIVAFDVNVTGFTLNSNNLTNAISINSDNVNIVDTVVNFNATAKDDVIAIEAVDSANLVLSNVTLNCNVKGNETVLNKGLYADNCSSMIIKDSKFNISLISAPITYGPKPDYTAIPNSVAIDINNCDDLQFINNDVLVDYTNFTGSYDTIYGIQATGDNIAIENNRIDANGHEYIYTIIASGNNLSVNSNNVNASSDGSYATAIQVAGPSTGVVSNNNISTIADNSVYGIYAEGSTGNLTADYINNTIYVNGAATWAIRNSGKDENILNNIIVADGDYTTGIGSTGKNTTIKNNTITVNGLGTGNVTSYDTIGVASAGVVIGSGLAVVSNNNVSSAGDNAVDLKTTTGNVVVDNYLISNLFKGNAAVEGIILNNTVRDNTPEMYRAVLTADNVVMYYKNGTKLYASLTARDGTPLANKTVVITINGVSYNRTTNENGSVSLSINLNSGKYPVNITFNGDNTTTTASSSCNVTIIPTISGNDVVKVFRNGTQYYATFVDGQGKALANTNVSFNVNGILYTRQTNENGTAKLNINLNPGKYIITAINSNTSEMHSNNITVLANIESSNLEKYYRNDSQFVVKVLGDDGNSVGAGETVTFNINGVLYTKTTDANGTAKLNINLGAGSYVITSTYKGCNVANNITVKSILSADNLNMKYKDGSKFKATLVDGQGKVLANKNVTFNVNGILYKKLTDSEGIASLNINLMPGKYIITSEYNGCKISNDIIIS